MNEQWKQIDGFEMYEVSDQGRVRRGDKVLRPKPNKCCGGGYFQVRLYKNGKQKHLYVHRLVANAFIKNTDGFPEVNHKDENKTNNAASNLEWCTRQYNTRYGTGIARKSKPVKCVETGEIFLSATDAERKTGILRPCICKCVKGRSKTAGGYRWQYAENERVKTNGNI